MKLSKRSALILLMYCIMASFFLSITDKEKSSKAPIDLIVSEGFINPIGFYNNTPNFSWQLPVSEKIKSQSAYQIVVASSKKLLSFSLGNLASDIVLSITLTSSIKISPRTFIFPFTSNLYTGSLNPIPTSKLSM